MAEAIELEIRDLYSPDVELRSWQPASAEAVCFLLELEIAERDDQRADLFQLVVATPEGLRRSARSFVVADRATLVVADYSYGGLREAVSEIVGRCAAATWEESVLKLQRYFRWEYEDYSP